MLDRIFEDMTPEKIRDNIMQRFGNKINTLEGSFASDMAAAAALEISKLYQAMDSYLMAAAFVDETSGEYLVQECADYGITRKPAAAAKGSIIVNATGGTLIKKGSALISESGVAFTTDVTVSIPKTGTANIPITAAIATVISIPASMQLSFVPSVSGVTAVSHGGILGGADEETDAALYARLKQRRQDAAASGNAADYKRWALECDGIGAARVIPLANGAGTVKVLVASTTYAPVDAATVAAVKAYIDSMKPIGATVTVASGMVQILQVDCVIRRDDAVELSSVQAEFRERLQAHYNTLTFNYDVLTLSAIGHILMQCSGVKDVINVKINNAEENADIGNISILCADSATVSDELGGRV